MKIVKTADGSSTLYHEQIGEHYHSMHGALQESKHVFLESGLKYFLNEQQSGEDQSVSVLEVGFGTGLNYLVTADYCETEQIRLNYTGVERYPLKIETLTQTSYTDFISPAVGTHFMDHYAEALARPVEAHGGNWQISVTDVLEFSSAEKFDVMYFDAFAAVHQPEMWSEQTLRHVTLFLRPGGVFVTYAITGNLKRTMKALGFRIQKIPGAPGKREMLRGIKE